MKYDFKIEELDMENGFGKILSQVKPNSVVLECGCAAGYMTRYMKEKLNCDVYIIEIVQEAFDIAIQYAKDGICTDLAKDEWVEKFAGMKFDTILFCDVLEHVYDPEALLKKALPFLREDGRMLVSLPNIAHNDILMRMYEGHWDYMDRGLLDDTHIRFWGPENVAALFEKTGLQITVFDATTLPSGKTEQYWSGPCHVDPQYYAALRKRPLGEVYQFILTVQHKAFAEKNHIKTDYRVAAPGADLALPPIWEAADTAEQKQKKDEERERLINVLMEDNEQLNANQKRINDYHAELTARNEELEVRAKILTEDRQKLMDSVVNLSALAREARQLSEQVEELRENNLYLQDENISLAAALKKITEQSAGAISNEQNLKNQIQTLTADRNRFEQELIAANGYMQAINESRAHRMAERYYKVRDWVFPVGSFRRKFAGHVVRGTKYLLRPRHPQPAPEQAAPQAAPPVLKSQIDLLHEMGKYKRMDIIVTKHCLFIAYLAKKALKRIGIECEIYTEEPEQYLDIPYLIICPQFIKRFPPVYFVFQLEQTISSRWFTPEYYQALQNSCVVLDYALQNIEFFHRPENADIRNRVYYVPLDYYANYIPEPAPEEKEYDVLFYGSIAGDRRHAILEAVGKRYNLKIISDMFGEELIREIRKAKVVMNIHYYEGALIETTRLFEVLSLNSSVIVSEDSFDKNEIGRLEPFVDFVPVDDTDKLIERIGYWLEHDEERKAKVRENQRALEHRSSAFDYFFYRFLLAHDRITFDEFYSLAGDFFQLEGNRVCLSLPESTERRRSFDEDNKYDFQCIPGLRHEKGWIGCGMSYKLIFRKAMEAKLKNLMICEDDVIFPADFTRRLQQIMSYLGEQKRWSVFSGVMADVGDVNVMGVKNKSGVDYVQLDHMISMVFNIYNKEMFAILNNWDESNRDVETNAIDRYLEKKKLAIYTILPFLVGHKEELNSTIWGFSNSQYADMISNSENKLRQLVAEYRENNPGK